MVEYALALLVVVFIAIGARWLVSSLRGNGERTLDPVSSEYPCPRPTTEPPNHPTTEP